jgi:tetratricopeptide (TPR) repeat protein
MPDSAKRDKHDIGHRRIGQPVSYDVFVSYRHAHANRVKTIVDALRARGLSVWLDKTNIEAFTSITAEARAALAVSKIFLAYYSADYPMSRPCQWELTQAYIAATRLGSPNDRVLVVNPERSPAHIEPTDLQDQRYLTVADDHLAFAKDIADAVRQRADKLDGLLGEVRADDTRWFPMAAVSAPRFVGRARDMWRLHSSLRPRDVEMTQGVVGPAAAVIAGLGGIGKSLLAQEYALRFAAAYPGGVFWLRASGENGAVGPPELTAQRNSQLRDLLRLLAPALGNSVDRIAPEAVMESLAACIERAGTCLWVVDDLPEGLSSDELRAWFGPSRARTLITTRGRTYGGVVAEVPLDVLDRESALGLLTAHRPTSSDGDQAIAEDLIDQLGCHALAIDVAGSALEFQSFAELQRGLADPSQDELELAASLHGSLPTGHERSISATLARSIERAGEEARDVLRLACVISPGSISTELITNVFGARGAKARRSIDAARRRRVKGLSQLKSSSLAEAVTFESWRVHHLVTRTLRFRESTERRLTEMQVAAADVLTSALERKSLGETDADLFAHVLALTSSAGPRLDAARATRLLDAAAAHLESHGKPYDVLAMATTARSLAETAWGDSDERTLKYLNNEAVQLLTVRRPDEAIPLLERVVTGTASLRGSEHLDLAIPLGNLASALREARRVDDSIPMYERALRIARASPSKLTRSLAWHEMNLAIALKESGSGDQARAQFEQALKISEQEKDDSTRAIILNNLGELARGSNRVDEGRDLHQRALEINRRLHTAPHLEIALTLKYLGYTHRQVNDPSGARRFFEQSLEMYEQMFGSDWPDVHELRSVLSGMHE